MDQETRTKAVKEALFGDNGGLGDVQSKILLEQYKIYVDSMEKLVSRRQTAHNIFLTANTLLLAAGGFVAKNTATDSAALGDAFPVVSISVAGILFSLLWWWLSLSYGALNIAKFQVIHFLETRLPVSIFEAERIALDQGEGGLVYRSMAKVEAIMPLIFVLFYIAICLYAIMGK